MRMIVGTPFVEFMVRSVSEAADEDVLHGVYDELKIDPPEGTYVDIPMRISLLGVVMYHDSATMPGHVMMTMNDGTAVNVRGEAKVMDAFMRVAYTLTEEK